MAFVVLTALKGNARHWFAIAAGSILVVLGVLSVEDAILSIDYNVIALVLGMSILTVYLEESGFIDVCTHAIERKVRNSFSIVLLITLLAGSISIFLENVTVVLLIAPIALRLAVRHNLNPIPIVIGTALASNMAGSATMVGDPPAVMAASHFNLSFMDFIFYKGKLSMFFMTLIPMIFACIVVSILAIRQKGFELPREIYADMFIERKRVNRVFLAEVSAFLGLKILLLSVRKELGIPLYVPPIIAVVGTTIVRALHRDWNSIKKAFAEGFEWRIVLFLIGVFMISRAFAITGLASDIAHAVLHIGRGDLFIITTLLVYASVAASAFIDNVPYTAAMLTVIDEISLKLGIDPVIIAWAVLLGTTLGGNLTYIGASANVVAVRYLEKHNLPTSFAKFIRLSLPFNTVSVVLGWIMFEAIYIL